MKKIRKWVFNNFRTEETMRILLLDEKTFDVNGICNSQKECIWTVSRAEANGRGGIKMKQKFPKKVMVWLGVVGVCM
jgi:hypothetical protein